MADAIPASSDLPPQCPPSSSSQSRQMNTPPSSKKPSGSSLTDIEKIKAAHAARRTRRSRPPRPPSSSVIPPRPVPTENKSHKFVPIESSSTDNSSEDGSVDASKDPEAKKIAVLNQELSNMRVELSSLRRNHLQNIKKITEERDMFAAELAKEQNSTKTVAPDTKKLTDLEAQLRASRTRNSDLEEENVVLRDEVKQLSFRVQASKTIDAATNGYEKVVDELVEAKLKCAQLQEEKEDLLRINKELMTTSAVLRDANGELEKSRSQWVMQCAEVEKKRADLESRLKDQVDSRKSSTDDDPSYSGSDLQELKL